MKSRFALAQLHPQQDPKENLRRAEDTVKEAVEREQADMVLFPEIFINLYKRLPGGENSSAQSLHGPLVQEMQRMAAEYKIWILFGMRELPENMPEKGNASWQERPSERKNRTYNTTVLLDSSGKIVSVYRKTHLYDAFGFRESDDFLTGDRLFQPIDTPFGKLGLFVCYELRFPEIARKEALEGAQILLVPAAWYQGPSKKEQFQLLARTRALENTVYLLACNQCGGKTTGGSLAVDPLGQVLAEAGEEEKLLAVTVDTDRIREVRETLPCINQRHPELYSESV